MTKKITILFFLNVFFISTSLLAQNKITVQVASGSDDMEEYVDDPNQTNTVGNVDFGSSDLELGSESGDGSEAQVVGIRFAGIEIPENAVILSAFIQFTVDESKSTDAAEFMIRAQADADPLTFEDAAFNISSRPQLPGVVNWSVAENTWLTAGEQGPDQLTPNLASLVQQAVEQDGWASGNSIVFFISGSGTRVAESYDGDAAFSPTLEITWADRGSLNETEFQISSSLDDVEEYIDGPMQTQTVGSIDDSSSDLELGAERGDGEDPQLVGLVFQGAGPNPAAVIAEAYIQFTVDETKNTDDGMFTIRAVAQPNPESFTTDNASVSSRPTFDKTVSWTVPGDSWGVAGESGPNQATPNIAELLNEIMSQDGYAEGNNVCFTIEGTNTKAAESFDGDPVAAPKLIIRTVPAATPKDFSARISASLDDVEEYIDGPNQSNVVGSIDDSSSDLELGAERGDGSDPQLVGLRWQNVEIPAGAIIESASIQFGVDESKNTDDGMFIIRAQADPNPDQFTTDLFSVSSRETFSDSVMWTVTGGTWTNAGDAGPDQETPDLSALLQMVVDQPGWESGNSVVFTIAGMNTKAAESFDGDPTLAPELKVSFFDVKQIRNRIAASLDDVEEYIDGPMQTQPIGSIDDSSSDLELGAERGDGEDPQLVGLVFKGIELSSADQVTGAYIQFGVDESKNTDDGLFTIRAVEQPNPESFTTDNASVSSRPTFGESVEWTVTGGTWTNAGDAGPDQRTADITSLVELIIGQDGWESGNNMCFTIEGMNTKAAESFDGDPTLAPELVITVISSEEPGLEPTDYPVAKNSEWSYFTDGTPSGDWTATDFDSESWAFGPGLLGFNVFTIATEIDSVASAYFRKPINIAKLNELTDSLDLRLLVDDEAVVYINGTQVVATMNGVVEDTDEGKYTSYKVSRDVFLEGLNVIAVEVSDVDGDMSFDIQLENTRPEMLPNSEFDLIPIGTYNTGIFDEGAAEIVTFDRSSGRLFSTNADANSISVVNIDDPTNPTLMMEIDMSSYGGGVNSVSAFDGVIAVAVEADEVTDNGSVVFFDADGNFLNEIEAGALPDMVTFNNAGTMVMVANEGEPNDEYTVDPPGTVTMIDVSGGVENAVATQITFDNLAADSANLVNAGLRIFGPGASFTQDLEPEYVAFTDNDAIAFIALQENNGVAVIDVATATAVAIVPMGFKDHSVAGNGFDASNVAPFINIMEHPTLGIYMPDAIESVNIGGADYILTANEGDTRDYDGYSEEARVADLNLDPTAYPDAATLQLDENLGRQLTSTTIGDTDGDGDVDQIYTIGARSFTIWDANGNVVFDSGDEFERVTAQQLPLYFNSSNDNSTLKNRSDDKGPEPEAIEVVKRGNKYFALIGLERVGGIMVYDITDPANATFVNYVNNRDFEADVTTPEAGDLGVEDIIYIDSMDSPIGEPLVVTANEVSGTITIFAARDRSNVPPPFTVRIMHNNDGESKLEPSEVNGFLIGGAAPFKTVVDGLREDPTPNVLLSSGDNFLAGIAFNASLNRAPGLPYYDAEVLDALDYDAIDIGNHDFDFGPDVLEKMITDIAMTEPPYLSANLDFTGEPGLQSLVDGGRIAPSTIVDVDGQQIGVIGLSPENLADISSPRNVVVLPNTADIVQGIVDDMTANGINKIILVSHLQSINNEIELAGMLTGVDVMITGGGDELLTNDPSIALPGMSVFGSYPLEVENLDGDPTYLVTTPGEYRYLGNLIVTFDENGVITHIAEESNPILVSNVTPDQEIQENIVDSVIIYAEDLDNNIIAFTEVDLDGTRPGVRTRETNQGNLITDAYLWLANRERDGLGIDPNARIIAVQNGGGIRDDQVIPANSDISEKKTFDILPFDNKVVISNAATPEQFHEIIEHAVSNVENSDGRFLQVGGFRFVYDPNGTPGENRVLHAILDDGTPMIINGVIARDAPDVHFVTNSFTLGGGDAFTTFPEIGQFANIAASYQRALFDFLVAEDGADGLVTATDYPAGGEGRILTDVLYDLSDAGAQMGGLEDYTTTPFFTVGQTIGDYTPPGIPDGMGALENGANVRLFVNHEFNSTAGYRYFLENGGSLRGGRVSYFDIDPNTLEIAEAGLAYHTIINRAGDEVTGEADLEGGGLRRPCSANLFEAGEFGLEDDIFFTGEETGGGTEFGLDVANQTLYALPWLGRAAWESVTLLDAGEGKVAVLVGDDRGPAPLLLYIGDKVENGDFIERNGLSEGTLYAWVADGASTPEDWNGTGNAISGTWEEISIFDAGQAGMPGYDDLGFVDQATQDQLVADVGGFLFSRPEDVATSPFDPTVAVMASTGRGQLYPSENWGTLYEIDVDFESMTADLRIIYDGDDAGNGQFAGPDFGLRSPDNLEWAAEGFVYVQEDRSTSPSDLFGGESGEEASIWKVNPFTGEMRRVAQMDRSAVPAGQTDSDPDDIGDWESSGIIDVEGLVTARGGDQVPFLANVQAHSLRDGIISHVELVQGGQLFRLSGDREEIVSTANPFSEDSPLIIAPNPTTDMINITFDIEKSSDVRIELYNTLGLQVGVISEIKQLQGSQNIKYSMRNLQAGHYFVRIQVGEFVESYSIVKM